MLFSFLTIIFILSCSSKADSQNVEERALHSGHPCDYLDPSVDTFQVTADPDDCQYLYECSWSEQSESWSYERKDCQILDPSNINSAFEPETNECLEYEDIRNCQYFCESFETDNYELWRKMCYFFIIDNPGLTYDQAAEDCSSRFSLPGKPACLVEISSIAEANWLKTEAIPYAVSLAGSDPVDLWIGIRDVDNAGVWRYSCNGNTVQPSSWLHIDGSVAGCGQVTREGYEQGPLESLPEVPFVGKSPCSTQNQGYICKRDAENYFDFK